MPRCPRPGTSMLATASEGIPDPGEYHRAAIRFVASRSPRRLDGSIVAHICPDVYRGCLSLVPAVLVNMASVVVTSIKQGFCVYVAAFPELSKSGGCGSQPHRKSTAAGSAEAVRLPVTALKQRKATSSALPINRPFRAQQMFRIRQSEQLFWRRTIKVVRKVLLSR